MSGLILLMVAVVLGVAMGFVLPKGKVPEKAADYVLTASLYVIIFLMGFKLGADKELFSYIGSVGLQALCLAVGAIALSVAFTVLLSKLSKKGGVAAVEEGASQSGGSSPLKTTAIIIAVLLVGMGCALLGGSFSAQAVGVVDTAVTVGLCVLVFASGFSIGSRKGILKEIKALGFAAVMVPVCVLAGSIIASLALAPLLGLTFAQSAAVGGSCGWYTLCGATLSTVSAKLGALGFLSNVMRELIALLTIPFVAKKFGAFAAAAPGGATAMDTTLPLTIKCVGPVNATVAFVSGTLLSLSTPFVLGFFVELM